MQLENSRTREDAIDDIDRTLTEATEEDRRFLYGFDFPFGYPSGTAQMLAGHFNREGDRNWAVVWELIADKIDECPNNWNNRFKAAAELNRGFRGEGPYWGRPTNPVIPCLGTAPPRSRWGVNLPPYRRHVERMFPGQALTGIEALREGYDTATTWKSGRSRHWAIASATGWPRYTRPLSNLCQGTTSRMQDRFTQWPPGSGSWIRQDCWGGACAPRKVCLRLYEMKRGCFWI